MLLSSTPLSKRLYAYSHIANEYYKAFNKRPRGIARNKTIGLAISNLGIKIKLGKGKSPLLSAEIWQAIKAEMQRARTLVIKKHGTICAIDYFFDNLESIHARDQELRDNIAKLLKPDNGRQFILTWIFKDPQIVQGIYRRVANDIFYNLTCASAYRALQCENKTIRLFLKNNLGFTTINTRRRVATESQLRALLWLFKYYQRNQTSKNIKDADYYKVGIHQLERFLGDMDYHIKRYDLEYKDNHTYRSIWL